MKKREQHAKAEQALDTVLACTDAIRVEIAKLDDLTLRLKRALEELRIRDRRRLQQRDFRDRRRLQQRDLEED